MSQQNSTTACVQLIHRLFMSVDHGHIELLSDLVCSDLTYVTPRMQLSSAQALIEAMHARPAGQITRHVITNFAVLQETSDGHCDGNGYLMMFRSLRKPDMDVATVPPIEGIADVRGVFRREPSGWRISHIVLEPIFVA